MRTFIALFCIFISNCVCSQQTICLGDDLTVCSGAINIENCPGGPNITTGINLNAPTVIPTLTDDSFSGPVPIGFDFTFYGNVFTQCTIGSNGIISFNMGNANGYCPWALGGVGMLPSAGTAATLNAIMPSYQDMNPSAAVSPNGNIQYQTIGNAPNRKLVILYREIGAFSCGITECNYTGVILYETSNNIEVHIGKKTVCATWNGGLAIQGIQNANGSTAHITPGRNNTVWLANNDAHRWEYQGGNNYNITPIPYVQITGTGSSLVWNNTLGNTSPYNNGTLNITNVPPGTTGYFLTSSACGTALGSVSDTSWITTASPEVLTSSTPDACSQSVGSVSASPGPGSPPPYTYSWPALGQVTQTVNNVAAGTYTVNMTDGNGCTTNASITVGDSPATFTSSFTPVSCAAGSDGTATAVMTPPDGTETFLWSDGQTTATAVGLSAGTHTCEISAGSGCNGTVTVVVDEIPSIILTIEDQNDALCNSLNNGMIMVDVTQGSSPYSYSWDQSNSTDSVANDLFAGTHTVTVTDFNGCSDQISLTIGEPESLSITNLTPDSVVCSEAFIDIEATGNGGSSPYIYTWTENGNSLDIGQTITVNPSGNNTIYCLTLSEECGSPTVSECLTVTFPDPINPQINPDIPVQCLPGEFIFSNTSSNAGEIFTTEYIFSSGDVLLANGDEDVQLTLPNPGVYDLNVNVISNYGCLYTGEFNNIVEVTSLPTANFNISQNPVTWFETEIQTSETSLGNVVDYNWVSPGSSSLINNGGSALISYPEGVTGTYPITLIVTTNEGCSDSITLEIEVVPDVIFYAPNTFTPDDDEHNQTWAIVIEGIDKLNFNLEIYNRWGETVWKSRDIRAEWDGTFGGKVVPEGTYIWTASYKEKNNDGKKIYSGYINVIR
ncbi:gliding motility-associated C-terminal domain-containing protein [Crocinitomicaceae bacterium]|nr:gliding motility-associated C-terminal domain-containing protein [Crocinitomicaceae bacterium]